MANQLRTNPWVIDTPGASILHSGAAFIATLQWSGYLEGTGARCTVQDGRTLADSSGPTTIFDWAGNADGSPISLQPGMNIKITDLIVSNLSSGRLTIWLE